MLCPVELQQHKTLTTNASDATNPPADGYVGAWEPNVYSHDFVGPSKLITARANRCPHVMSR